MIEHSYLQPSARTLALAAAGLAVATLPALVSAPLWPLWLAFCALMVLACGVDAILCPRPGQLCVEPELPTVLYMAAGAEARLLLTLPLPWPVAAEATLDVSELLEPVGLRRLRLGAATVLSLRLEPRRRGEALVESLWLRYSGPLGLVRRTLRWRLDQAVHSVPNVELVRSAALRFFNVRETLAGLKIERYPGDGTEFHALQEYTAGLEPRAIDWKASARHARLLARECRAERNHSIVLALDTGRLMAEPVDGAPLVDHAIHAALELSCVSLRHGDRVSLFAFAEKPRLFATPRSGAGALPALIELTRRLDYGTAETNFTLGLTDLALRLRRRSLVIVLTDFVDSVTGELMVDNLLRLRRRHLVLFVALRDPLLDQERGREPRTLVDLNRAVVAEALIHEREVVIRRLGKAGVKVIDSPPRAVGTALINRYLEIKRREMI